MPIVTLYQLAVNPLARALNPRIGVWPSSFLRTASNVECIEWAVSVRGLELRLGFECSDAQEETLLEDMAMEKDKGANETSDRLEGAVP